MEYLNTILILIIILIIINYLTNGKIISTISQFLLSNKIFGNNSMNTNKSMNKNYREIIKKIINV